MISENEGDSPSSLSSFFLVASSFVAELPPAAVGLERLEFSYHVCILFIRISSPRNARWGSVRANTKSCDKFPETKSVKSFFVSFYALLTFCIVHLQRGALASFTRSHMRYIPFEIHTT